MEEMRGIPYQEEGMADAVRHGGGVLRRPGTAPLEGGTVGAAVPASNAGPGTQVGRSASERTRYVSICGF